MAKVTIRRTGEFLREIFVLLWEKPEGMKAKDILSHLGNTFELSEYEKGYYPSSPNYPRYTKIVRFATIDVVKAGWLIKNKGVWFLTDEGKEAYEKYTDPEEFYSTAKKLYFEWKKSRPKDEAIEDLEIEEESQSISVTFEEAEENSWEEIKDHLSNLDGYEFQDLVADLLQAMGYHVSWVAPPGKDKGIDIIAYNDPLGTSTPRIKVQVKKHETQSINVGDLRSFMSVLGVDDVGIYVSFSGFTRDAFDEARTQENRKITLLNLEALFDLWVKYYENLTQEARQRLPLKPIYFLAPEE